jgi:SAM-dependent methyltransferase
LPTETNPTNYRYQLIEADITQELPFAANTFDLILAVHVFHIIENWRAALDQAKRVLKKPTGWLLIAQTGGEYGRDTIDGGMTDMATATAPSYSNPRRIVGQKWDAILRELGVEPETLLPGLGHSKSHMLEAYLSTELGATTVQQVSLLEYEQLPSSLAAMVKRHQTRIHSRDWALPDTIYAEASQRLQQWLDEEIGKELANKSIAIKGEFKVVAVNWSE